MLNVEGLQPILTANGVTHFSAQEVLELKNRRARKFVGAPRFAELPDEYRDSVINLGLYLETIRRNASSISGQEHPIRVLGWYRPGLSDSRRMGWSGDYNLAAGGTPPRRGRLGSAHIRAAGVDIRSAIGKHADLMTAIVNSWRMTPPASGVGWYLWGRVHVDICHPGGARARQWSSRLVRKRLKETEVAIRANTQSERDFGFVVSGRQ